MKKLKLSQLKQIVKEEFNAFGNNEIANSIDSSYGFYKQEEKLEQEIENELKNKFNSIGLRELLNNYKEQNKSVFSSKEINGMFLKMLKKVLKDIL